MVLISHDQSFSSFGSSTQGAVWHQGDHTSAFSSGLRLLDEQKLSAKGASSAETSCCFAGEQVRIYKICYALSNRLHIVSHQFWSGFKHVLLVNIVHF